MTSPIILAMPGNEALSASIAEQVHAETGKLDIRNFPDGESYVRILSDVARRNVIVVCTLDRPDSKLLQLYFLCKGLREAGVQDICLIAPYISYMRQDKKFHD